MTSWKLSDRAEKGLLGVVPKDYWDFSVIKLTNSSEKPLSQEYLASIVAQNCTKINFNILFTL